MTDGTSQGLFIVVAIVIFGIFVVLAYILFEDTLSPALASMFTEATEVSADRLSKTTNDRFFEFDKVSGKIIDYRDDDLTDNHELPLDVVIPDEIDGVAVKVIGREAFFSKGINSVVLPKHLETIDGGSWNEDNLYKGKYFTGAFAYNNLTEIVFPEKMGVIPVASFVGNKISKIDFGNIHTIGTDAFNNNHMKYLEIPGTVRVVGKQAFSSNHSETIVLHEGIEVIDTFAFWHSKFEEITIPKSATRIHGGIVSNNHNLKTFNIPAHLKSQVDSDSWILIRTYFNGVVDEYHDESIVNYY